jgi:hypothetical protein
MPATGRFQRLFEAARIGSVIGIQDLAPSSTHLAEQLKGKVKEVFTIGDAKSFRPMWQAIFDGYVTAYQL